ncbi:MAG: 30S ribosomal protein S6 [Candidatus Rokubacteria bacterium]|nr:30S ribosomal protein S6 [Candidatus Rokubacteria bacterium]
MRLYDLLIIVDPRPGEEEVAQLSGALQEAFTNLGGQVLAAENWGKRRLTFEIRKQREGTYLLLQVSAEPTVVREYERQLRLNESVLRFMTTRVIERRRKAGPEGPATTGLVPGPEPSVEPKVEEVG